MLRKPGEIDLPSGVLFDSYRADQAWWKTKFVWAKMMFLLFIVFFIIPQFAPGEWIGIFNMVGYTILAAWGVQLLIGYTNLITLGHAAPIGFGAFACALSMYLWNVPFIVGMIIALVAGGLLSLVFGLPCVKVKGFYIIMTTMAMQFITVDIILTQFLGPLAGRGRGGVIALQPGMFNIGPWMINTDVDSYYLVMILVVIFQVFMANLMRTRVGRAWAAIRDNDIAAETLGVNIFWYKLLAFFVAGAMGGIAGSYWLTTISAVSPEHFMFPWSLWLVGVIIIGGIGSMYGTIYGAIFMTVGLELIKMGVMSLATIYPLLTQKFLYIKNIFFGLIIMLFLIFEPHGLSYRWWQFKNYIHLWPFSY